MNIRITGANGYIGKELVRQLKASNHFVKAIDRSLLYGSTIKLANELAGTDAIINLAGAPIMQPWNKVNKAAIYNSRVLTTKKLCKAINLLHQQNQPQIFISASAVGIYAAGAIHDESSTNLASNFTGKVTRAWEEATFDLNKSIRKIVFRIGIVIGKESQSIQKMLPIFKLGLGARIGSGRQAFPFIHINDLTQAFTQAIEVEKYKGAFNLVAPQHITNREFTKSFAHALKRSSFLSVPSVILKLIFGERAELLIDSPIVIPKRLIDHEFDYQFPTIDSALSEIKA